MYARALDFSIQTGRNQFFLASQNAQKESDLKRFKNCCYTYYGNIAAQFFGNCIFSKITHSLQKTWISQVSVKSNFVHLPCSSSPKDKINRGILPTSPPLQCFSPPRYSASSFHFPVFLSSVNKKSFLSDRIKQFERYVFDFPPFSLPRDPYRYALSLP